RAGWLHLREPRPDRGDGQHERAGRCTCARDRSRRGATQRRADEPRPERQPGPEPRLHPARARAQRAGAGGERCRRSPTSSRVQSANLGLNLAYILLGRAPSGLEQAAIGVGGNLVLSKYSRSAEDEADAVAIPMLMGAGINPRGLLTFFDELLAQQRRSPSSV